MKRVGFYRRTQHGESSYKERIVWQLSKRPMTGREIRKLLNLDKRQFNGAINDSIKGGKVTQIERYDRHDSEDGIDYWYRLIQAPKFIAPKCDNPRMGITVSAKQAGQDHAEMQRINTERAARRARLIKAGLYVDELG